MATIEVRDRTFRMTEDYLAGARGRRNGLRNADHDGRSGRALEDWLAGYGNERDREHVRFGIDLAGLESSDRRAFGIDPEVPRDGGGVDRDWYQLAMMRASGMLRDATALLEGSPLTPPKLRDALRAKGHALDAMFAETVMRRVWHETEAKGRPLTAEEIAIVESLREPRQVMLLAIARLADRHFKTMLPTWLVAAQCRKGQSWPAATALKMERDGQGFLVHFTANGYCALTKAGWTASRLIADLRAAKQVAEETAAREHEAPELQGMRP
jgi:hypothetical protein